MAYDTTEAVAKFLSGFQMKITKRERDTVAPDYYVKYLLTLSKGGKDFSTTFVSDPRAFGEPTVTQVFSALADDALTLHELNAYSGVPAAAHRASYPLVEFYDTSQDAARFPGGQFVSRYYMTDLLEDDSIAVFLDTMLKSGNPFSLDGGIPAWTVEGDDLAKVNAFLKETCKEVFGILPGADDGGYSLSGEAREAALSRFALPENRKAALNMIRKLNESRDSNDNAL